MEKAQEEEKQKSCPRCHGSGRRKITMREDGILRGTEDAGSCNFCKGTGKVPEGTKEPEGLFVITGAEVTWRF